MAKLNTTNYAILGLLTLQPMSGYDIKKTIERSIGHFWQDSYGHIYPTLKKLHADKLVRRATVRGKGKPDSYVYSLTALGKEKLKEWLAVPVDRIPVRNELLLKIAFGEHLAPEILIANLERYLNEQLKLTRHYNSLIKYLAGIPDEDGPGPDPYYATYTVRFGIHAVRGRIRWCRETLAELKSRKTQKKKKTIARQ